MQQAIVRIEAELQERLAWFEKEGKLLEAQRLRMRTQYDLEMMQEVGFCNGIENYSAPDRRPRRRARRPTRCSTSSPRTSWSSSTSRHQSRAAAARPVRGRPQPQGDADRARLPAAVGGRQPAAAVRGVHGAGRPDGLPVGHARARTSCEQSDAGRRAGRAAHRPGRPRGHRQAHQGPDRRPHRADQRARRPGRPGAGHHAHQEDGRGPHRLPARAGRARCATCTPRSTPSSASRSCATCASASSTCWSASTCCGRASTCPRCRWWPSSTPTRRASSAARRRSSRPSAGPPATSTAR